MKILVADDALAARKLIKSMLQNLELNDITLCESGEKALELIRRKHFDLIFMDWHFEGGMSGLECVKKIKSNPETAAVSIMMLTAEQSSGNIRQAIIINLPTILDILRGCSNHRAIPHIVLIMKKPMWLYTKMMMERLSI